MPHMKVKELVEIVKAVYLTNSEQFTARSDGCGMFPHCACICKGMRCVSMHTQTTHAGTSRRTSMNGLSVT